MDLAQQKQRDRATWSSGDYAAVADLIWEVGKSAARHAAVRPGDEVLDVACGTGNAGIAAALAGGSVTGLDLTPELFEAGRERAAAAGVELRWLEGDAEDLPFGDASFDVVLSTFGCMFAPRHAVTAAELVRVLRPGGRLAVCSWRPSGHIGEFFKTIGAHMPAPPEGFEPPILWGTEDHVREIFAGTGVEPAFEEEAVDFRFESPDAGLDFYATKFGPLVKARELLEPAGGWQGLIDDMRAFLARNATSDGTVRFPGEYLVIIGHKGA